MNILIVDDNKTKRALLAELAELCKLQTTEAECGRDAVQLASVIEFDIILLDYHLLDCTGDQVLGQIRSGKHANKSTMFVLASNDIEKSRSYKHLGFDECLAPPFYIEGFEKIISEYYLRKCNKCAIAF